MVAVILNLFFITSTTYHESIHGFWVGHSTGTEKFEVKLLQQVTDMREEVLHAIFPDLHKA